MDGHVLHLHPQRLNWHFLDVKLERGMASLLLLIGFVCWPGMVRVIRAQVLTIKEREFVQASKALGASSAHIMFAQVVPNILPTVIVLAAMTTASTITLEAGLGYLASESATGSDLGFHDFRWPGLLHRCSRPGHRTGVGHNHHGSGPQSAGTGIAGSAQPKQAMRKLQLLANWLLFCAVPATVILAAEPATNASHRGGTLRLAFHSELNTLDPAIAFDGNSLPLSRLLFRGLLDYDGATGLVNSQAKDWNISPEAGPTHFTCFPVSGSPTDARWRQRTMYSRSNGF